MSQLDLDDLPPRVAAALSKLEPGEELVLVRGGLVIARLTVADTAVTEPAPSDFDQLPEEERVSEILSQFNAMIHDEF
ncbi:MAG TPA: hypothetical protein VG939_06580 [Caulobacteraceae bacterium]|nr:hypothetical protein [Caulobacteraceae bacterium]